ncbi:MAG TPA: response regulator [Xanthomonadaceae bacterium]|nr:response regulator [Xanthomonadaceae bacterium]
MDPHLHILLAEDDPVSRSFLNEVLSAVGTVVPASDGETALSLATRQRFDLLVLDQNLPRLSGLGIVAALREDPCAASTHARMIALSAGLDDARARELCACGFESALPKPIDAAALLASVHGCSPVDATAGAPPIAPVLDDAGALRALGGNPDTVSRLRTLLAKELPAQMELVAERFLARDAEGMVALLHRLQAGCGFCGAVELAEAGQHLARHVRAGQFDEDRITAFLQAARRLQSALGAAVVPGADS